MKSLTLALAGILLSASIATAAPPFELPPPLGGLNTPPQNAHRLFDPRLLQLIPDRPETAISDPAAKIKRGKQLFTEETFEGNGRTCATCHPATNNFTVDAAFIATLPPTDPLFVAEFNPDLAFLEVPALMRQFGLICENLDGFDQPCVMRGVPHTFGLRPSITPPSGFPLVNATGWSGDGAPGDGSLMQFATGAIFQHLTKKRSRIPGVDFRVPTKQELEDMEAFQLSIGEQADISLDGVAGPALVFNDQVVEVGKQIFVDGSPGRTGAIRSCAACHNQGGANLRSSSTNVNINTGTALLPGAQGPLDDGFGRPGDGTFNVPSLIHAAATGPWFHNNAVSGQIENAIQFYASDTFNASPSGNGNAFVLTQLQVNQLGALLRALNARQAVIDGIKGNNEALRQGTKEARTTTEQSLSDTRTALRVLATAPQPLFQLTGVVGLLNLAAQQEQAALERPGNRVFPLRAAISAKQQALAQLTR